MPLPTATAPDRTEKHPLTFHITESDHFLGHFYLKKRSIFPAANSPCRRGREAVLFGRENIPLYSISPSWTTFWDIYPQKTGVKKEARVPIAVLFAAVIIRRRHNCRPRSEKSAKNIDKLLQFKLI